MTEPHNLPSLGKRFKQVREHKGLLIRQVAAVVETDQALISKIENGERTPTREQVIKLAGLYVLDVNEMLAIWLSEKIIKDYGNYEFAPEALRVAETQIRFSLKITNTKKDE